MLGTLARRFSLGTFILGLSLLQFWPVQEFATRELDGFISFGSLLVALSGLTYLAWTLRK